MGHRCFQKQLFNIFLYSVTYKNASKMAGVVIVTSPRVLGASRANPLLNPGPYSLHNANTKAYRSGLLQILWVPLI